MIVAGIVISGLLYLVVELLQMDRREAALTQTQRDMQRAMDYIADDIREAVFVYSDPTTVMERTTGGVSIDGVSDLPAGSIPILAFWRPVEIENIPDNVCDRWAPGGAADNVEMYDKCQVLKIRQASYSLVIYAQKARSTTDTVWKGASRIIRYELDKYDGPITNLDTTPGYQDPTTPGIGFDAWVASPDADTDGASNVLVDFVDRPADMTITATPPTNPCTTLGLNAAQYDVVPKGLSIEQNPSFLGCIRKAVTAVPGGAVDDAGGSNSSQDVYLYLRGNATDGATGSVSSFSEASSLPTLETRVLMRGVVNKNPT